MRITSSSRATSGGGAYDQRRGACVPCGPLHEQLEPCEAWHHPRAYGGDARGASCGASLLRGAWPVEGVGD